MGREWVGYVQPIPYREEEKDRIIFMDLLKKNDLQLDNPTLEEINQFQSAVNNISKFLLSCFKRKIDITLENDLEYDVEDYIDEILINFNILNIESVREDALEFASLVIEASEAVKEALEFFKNFKKVEPIKEKVIAINILEDKGDRLYEKVMKKLYSEEKNAIEIIKWTTIYDCFENAMDACESIADEMADIIMKNS